MWATLQVLCHCLSQDSLAFAALRHEAPRILRWVLLPSAAKKKGLHFSHLHLTLPCHVILVIYQVGGGGWARFARKKGLHSPSLCLTLSRYAIFVIYQVRGGGWARFARKKGLHSPSLCLTLSRYAIYVIYQVRGGGWASLRYGMKPPGS